MRLSTLNGFIDDVLVTCLQGYQIDIRPRTLIRYLRKQEYGFDESYVTSILDSVESTDTFVQMK